MEITFSVFIFQRILSIHRNEKLHKLRGRIGAFSIFDKYRNTFFGEGIFEDSQGNIWFGSYRGEQPGILQYDGNSFTRYDTTAGVIGSIVHSFAEDANGNIIAASNYGLARFDTSTGQWSNWNPHPDRKLGDYSQHIGSDARGNVWIPGGDSLFKWDGSKLHSIGLPKNMDQVSARNLNVSPEGHVWMAGGPGVKVYADSAWHEPLSGAIVYGMAHGSDGRTYLGTYQDGLYVYDRSHVVSTPDSRQRPEQISLGKNYPNPFNPTTRIKYSLPQAADVTLTVYDVLGRKVRTLVDSRQSAGSHRVTFDAGNLSSGVYIYRLQADGFSKTRKMMLVK